MTKFKTFLALSIIILSLSPFINTTVSSFDKEEKFIKTELFFGLSKPDGSTISDSEFDAFADTVISKVFNKGATIMKSDGRWLEGDKLIKEESRVVIYFTKLYEMTDEFSDRVDEIREKYKIYYQQEAVLRTDEFINASF